MKKTKPAASTPLSSTIRDDGTPSGVAVDSTMALGSCIPRLDRVPQPPGEHVHRVRLEVGEVEAAAGVLLAQGGQVDGAVDGGVHDSRP